MDYNKNFSMIVMMLFVLTIFFAPEQSFAQVVDGVTIVPVDAAINMTVYEKTGVIRQYDYYVPDLKKGEQKISTSDGEEYVINLSGPYVKINCYRNSAVAASSVGNNIAGVKLGGVYGYPEGLWASIISNYKLGYGGVAQSRFSALGNAFNKSSNSGYIATAMGDGDSEMTLGFSIPQTKYSDVTVLIAQISAKIQDLQKQLANLKKNGNNPSNNLLKEICNSENGCKY